MILSNIIYRSINEWISNNSALSYAKESIIFSGKNTPKNSSTERIRRNSKGGDDDKETNKKNIPSILGFLIHQLDQKLKNIY